jgi:hypothetical protein
MRGFYLHDILRPFSLSLNHSGGINLALQLSDLDELSQKVRNSHSRNYFNEAITSYRAGAYRAAIISTWIAVCIDIIEKIRELSLSGDSTAKTIEERLKRIQPTDVAGMLAFEKEVLNYAYDQLQLISIIEKSHLERLKDDRNACAHPTFSLDGTQFSPLPELAKAYIVQAANYLLIHAPVKGRVVIKHIFDLVKEESFPEDEEKAFVVLSSDSYLGRVRDSSVRNLIIIFLKRLFRDDERISIESLYKISSALGAIYRLYPKIYIEVLSRKFNQLLAEANDKQLKRILPFLIKRSESWGKIESAVKIRIQQIILTMNADDLISHQVSKLSSLNPDINSILQDRIEHLEYPDKIKLVEATPVVTLKKHAITIFVMSGSFNTAYSNGMKIIVPYAEYLDDDDIKVMFDEIFENSTWSINQILNAGGIDEVFCRLYKGTKNNIGKHGLAWKNFYQKAHSKGHDYEGLKQLLILDGEIEQDPDDVSPKEEKIPF